MGAHSASVILRISAFLTHFRVISRIFAFQHIRRTNRVMRPAYSVQPNLR